MKTLKTSYIVLFLSLLAVVSAVYWRSIFLPFIQDDWGMLAKFKFNGTPALISQMLNYENKLFYRPLAEGYLLLMYRLFGPNPIPFHIVALIVHVINSFLVALIIHKITGDQLIGYLTALFYAAGIAIHLDPLAWAVGIYDVGGAFFFLLSFGLFISKKPVISAIFYFIGCLFKESIILLPVILFFYLLLFNSTVNLREKAIKIQMSWRQTMPFILAMTGILIIKVSGGLSPFDYSPTHPYFLSLTGDHIIKNFMAYQVWMFQTILPFLSVRVYENEFILHGKIISLLIGLFIVLLVFRLRNDDSIFRRILFLLVWLCVSLLPVLLLPNHTYRYYATYALPAFIGLSLLLVKYALVSFHAGQKVIATVLIGIVAYRFVGL